MKGALGSNIASSVKRKMFSLLLFSIRRFEPTENLKRSPITKRAKFTVNEEPLENMSNKLIVSTLLGAVATFNWEGFLCKEGKPEYVKQVI